MKTLIVYALFLISFLSCTTPGPVTANPDDATSTPGTVGSSKMTEQMPERPDVKETRRNDTLDKRKIDSLPNNR